ncbi:hypothetical protein HHK36_000176 [Tetracentron sinense]|uniref:Uncharacterized protein n=1 Tax=Tetracentron sinense TaxID=13715 RepID=A0A835DQK2_TETSI|nr:hypothetical protein HHK36_000176 [Tetracentron sinense]
MIGNRFRGAMYSVETQASDDSEEQVRCGFFQRFLHRCPVTFNGVCLGIGSQSILWKTLATIAPKCLLHICLTINLVVWYISLIVIATVFFIYLLKIIIHFKAVRDEYEDRIRVNYFFAPWIALLFLGLGAPSSLLNYFAPRIAFLFLALGAPSSLPETLHEAIWYILMFPIFCLDVKIYGEWLLGDKWKLSEVANPSNHLAIVGNFVGALLGATMGLKEGALFIFAVGLAHYAVLFVTLYQRLTTNKELEKNFRPVFFLFVAAPSVASMAWASIQGTFDNGSRIAFFVALFLYFSLVRGQLSEVNFYPIYRFSLSCWAYSFPMTGAAIAAIKYSNEVTNILTRSLAVILSAICTITVATLVICTIYHGVVLQDLCPNFPAKNTTDSEAPRT